MFFINQLNKSFLLIWLKQTLTPLNKQKKQITHETANATTNSQTRVPVSSIVGDFFKTLRLY